MSKEEKTRLRLEETIVKTEKSLMEYALEIIVKLLFPHLEEEEQKISENPDLITKIIRTMLINQALLTHFRDSMLIRDNQSELRQKVLNPLDFH